MRSYIRPHRVDEKDREWFVLTVALTTPPMPRSAINLDFPDRFILRFMSFSETVNLITGCAIGVQEGEI